MPKAVQYKTNSIVYFKGDVNERVYILKSGAVSLNYTDIETMQEQHDIIRTGEFFGVKSALGRYPREETAVVLKDASMVVFSVPEFENLALQNTRIIMKMLKVFSNQLRRIHKQVQNLLTSSSDDDPETGLYSIGEYYLKCKKYHQALYAFRRYVTYYPNGKYSQEVTEKIAQTEQYAQGGKASTPAGTGIDKPYDEKNQVSSSSQKPPEQLSDVAKTFYNGVSLFSQEKYKDAYKEFNTIVNNGGDSEYEAKSLFEIGRCHYGLQEFDQCIKHFTAMIQKYPKHPEINEALFHVGACYEKKGDTQKAANFYNKILTIAEEGESVYRKAKKALRNLKG